MCKESKIWYNKRLILKEIDFSFKNEWNIIVKYIIVIQLFTLFSCI